MVMLAATTAPTLASADAQLSSRLQLGGGVYTEVNDWSALFDFGVHADVLFGGAEPDVVRVGPMLDLRTRTFATAEAATGASVLLPLGEGWPLTITGGLGWALREGDDGAFALGKLAFGFRDYNYHSAYGYALELYATARVDVGDPSRVDLSFGASVDLMFILVVPVLYLVTLFSSGSDDP
jgi:hypothetical protein